MLNREPTVIINGLSELVRQILPLLVVVGVVNIAPEKQAAWISIIGLVLFFISTVLLRSQVVPTVTANSQIEKAVTMPAGTTVKEVIAAEKKENE